ncbi:MAG: hypothetical protein HY935_02300 [Nitrosomonadales bacterium]|nr:hypothetical protein [Nitrosomonadales bacterium]
MFAPWKINIAILSASALLGMGANAALAEEHNHDAHAHHAVETAQLTLNNGKKWETDENLRLGMTRIRDALSAELPAIHSGKATAEQYQALARKTNDQIAFMVKKCKLEPKTDEMLHIVLTDIMAGADAMSGKDINEALKGAEKIAAALDNYGTYFAHPGWHGVNHTH